MEKYIFIKPDDTLFFRDGRPFERGIENFARSIFPPLPSVFYGALRTICILENTSIDEYYKNCKNGIDSSDEKMSKLIKVIGCKDEFGSLEIVGPFIRDENGRIYVLIPFDILKTDNKKFFNLTMIESEFCSNLPVNLNLAVPENEEEGEYYDFFINLEDLINYYLFNFNNDKIKENITQKENVIKNEYKVGIKIDKKIGTSLEGFLYSAEHIRMKDNYGFLIGVNNDEDIIPDKGSLRLGGDTRVAYFERLNSNPFDTLRNIIRQSVSNKTYLKFILLTPAIFNSGWYPDFLNKNDNGYLYGNFNGLELKLVSAVLGKSIYIGGFDIANKYPKEMKKAIPAGSIFFFEVKNSDIKNLDDFIINNNFKSIESDEYYKKQGFGITLIGGG